MKKAANLSASDLGANLKRRPMIKEKMTGHSKKTNFIAKFISFIVLLLFIVFGFLCKKIIIKKSKKKKKKKKKKKITNKIKKN